MKLKPSNTPAPRTSANHWETRMTLTDLTDTNFNFDCEFSGDGVEYFDCTLHASVNDENYYLSLYETDIEYLRENCKRILAATEGFVNEGY